MHNKIYPIPEITREQIQLAEEAYKSKKKKKKVITIEVDEDDDSYADIEVKGSSAHVETARPKPSGKTAELPYRRPTSIEMLSAEDDEPTKE